MRCLLQVQPCRLLSHLLSQENGGVGDLDERAGRVEKRGKLRAANPVTNTL